MSFSLRAEDYSDWEEGAYLAKVQDVQYYPDGGWEDKPRLEWKFEILEEGEYKGRTLTRRTSTAFSPRANARAFAEVLLGKKIQSGEEVRTQDLVGKPCNIQVMINETDRGTFANVDKVYPIRKNQQQAVTPQSEVEEANEEDFESIPF